MASMVRQAEHVTVSEQGSSPDRRSAIDRGLDYVAEWPQADYLVALLLTGAHVLFVREAGMGDVLTWGGREVRKDVFTSFIAFITFVGGFGVLALSIYTAARGARVGGLRSNSGRELRRTLRAGLTGPVVSALVLICVIAVDVKDADPVGIRYIAEGAIMLGLLRLGRLGYVLGGLITANDLDQARPLGNASPAPAPAFDGGPKALSSDASRPEYGLPPAKAAPRRRPPAASRRSTSTTT